MTTLAAAPSSTRRAWSRGVLAGPVCFLTAALVMCGGALWLPQGPAAIDNLVLPVVLFPILWAPLFFYTLLDRKLARAWLVTGMLFVVHAGWIAQHILAEKAAAANAAAAAPTALSPPSAPPMVPPSPAARERDVGVASGDIRVDGAAE